MKVPTTKIRHTTRHVAEAVKGYMSHQDHVMVETPRYVLVTLPNLIEAARFANEWDRLMRHVLYFPQTNVEMCNPRLYVDCFGEQITLRLSLKGE